MALGNNDHAAWVAVHAALAAEADPEDPMTAMAVAQIWLKGAVAYLATINRPQDKAALAQLARDFMAEVWGRGPQGLTAEDLHILKQHMLEAIEPGSGANF